ncbi:MAG: regulatory protein RecX [Clostridia bacterium]|nr:regulatory protein RecX [Clostridia bacterium]
MKKQTLENYEQTKDKALRLLTFRAHSEKELCDKLRMAGAKEEDIERTLEFCRRYEFVNDLQYAKSKARDLKNLKKYGKRRIEAELYSKGISSEAVSEAVGELEFDDDILKMLVEKKLANNFEKKSIDRCMRYFLYRGYEMSDIRNCIEEIKGETDEF